MGNRLLYFYLGPWDYPFPLFPPPIWLSIRFGLFGVSKFYYTTKPEESLLFSLVAPFFWFLFSATSTTFYPKEKELVKHSSCQFPFDCPIFIFSPLTLSHRYNLLVPLNQLEASRVNIPPGLSVQVTSINWYILLKKTYKQFIFSGKPQLCSCPGFAGGTYFRSADIPGDTKSEGA